MVWALKTATSGFLTQFILSVQTPRSLLLQIQTETALWTLPVILTEMHLSPYEHVF